MIIPANDEESQKSTVKKANDAKPEQENNLPQKEKTTGNQTLITHFNLILAWKKYKEGFEKKGMNSISYMHGYNFIF